MQLSLYPLPTTATPVDQVELCECGSERAALASDEERILPETTSLFCGSCGAWLDTDDPPSGQVRFYLVRAETACGEGPLGLDSIGEPRSATGCP